MPAPGRKHLLHEEKLALPIVPWCPPCRGLSVPQTKIHRLGLLANAPAFLALCFAQNLQRVGLPKGFQSVGRASGNAGSTLTFMATAAGEDRRTPKRGASVPLLPPTSPRRERHFLAPRSRQARDPAGQAALWENEKNGICISSQLQFQCPSTEVMWPLWVPMPPARARITGGGLWPGKGGHAGPPQVAGDFSRVGQGRGALAFVERDSKLRFCAGVAQWQSSRFVSGGSEVRLLSPAPGLGPRRWRGCKKGRTG